MKPSAMYQRTWPIILFAQICMSQLIKECDHFDSCLCFKIVTGIRVICEGPNVTLTEICGICDQLNNSLDDSVRILEVRDTVLITIPNDCFGECDDLETLTLKSTGLVSLESDALHSLHKLKHLNLDNNNLVQNCEFINPATLENVYNLQSFSIQHNVDDLECESGKPFLANLPMGALENLKELHTDGVTEVQFGRNFRNYKNLTHLTLSGHASNCSIFSLSNITFGNTPTITHLDISKCNITNIDAGAFGNLLELIHLNLSYNQGLGFAPLRNISYGLRETKIKVLDYSKVYKTFGIGNKLTACDVWHLKDTPIEELYLGRNRWSMIETNVLYMLPSNLKKAYASDNRLTYGPFYTQLGCLKNLELLDLNFQNSVHDLDAYNDEINVVEKHYETEKCKIPKWNTTENPNCPYYTNDALVNYWDFRLPRNVTTFSMRGSAVESRLVFNASLFIRNKVVNLDISNNVIYFLDNFPAKLPHLRHLNISKNFVTHISNYFFEVCENVEALILSHNLLGSTMASDTDGLILKPLKRLKVLDLSFNGIALLHKDTFKHIENIAELNLSHNDLTEFNFEIGHLRKLIKLDVRNNRLDTIPVRVLDELKQISYAEHRNVSIDLTNNNLLVSCQNIPFLSWLTENPNFFTVIDKYEFRETGSHASVTYNEMLKRLPNLKKHCVNYSALIIVSSVAVLTFLIVVVAGIIYRYRWRLKYLYYMTRARYRNYDRLSENHQEEDYTYDAFISFANDEIRFVIYEVLPKLENEFGLKLCVHVRDFLPGNYIAENITRAIQRSRKTVVILSENYLKSKWCQHEFHMARMEGIYSREGQSVLFVLIYKEIETSKLSLEMLDCLQGETYARYHEDHTERPYLWESIQRALK